MKLADIPEDGITGIYLAIAESDGMSEHVEVVGWTTSAVGAAWWAARPGVRVAYSRTVAGNGEVRAWL